MELGAAKLLQLAVAAHSTDGELATQLDGPVPSITVPVSINPSMTIDVDGTHCTTPYKAGERRGNTESSLLTTAGMQTMLVAPVLAQNIQCLKVSSHTTLACAILPCQYSLALCSMFRPMLAFCKLFYALCMGYSSHLLLFQLDSSCAPCTLVV